MNIDFFEILLLSAIQGISEFIPVSSSAHLFLISDIYEISLNYSTMIIGFFTSMLFAFFTIKYFLAFVDKIGMIPFVIYRLILGVALLALL